MAPEPLCDICGAKLSYDELIAVTESSPRNRPARCLCRSCARRRAAGLPVNGKSIAIPTRRWGAHRIFQALHARANGLGIGGRSKTSKVIRREHPPERDRPERSTQLNWKRRGGMARFLYTNLEGQRLKVVTAITLTVLQVFATIAVAFPLKFVLDKVVNHHDPSFPLSTLLIGPFDHLAAGPQVGSGGHTEMGVILFSAALAIALGLFVALLTYVQLFIAAYVGQSLAARLRTRLFEHLQRISLTWHGRQRTGDLVQRLTSNVNDIEKLVTDGLVDLLAGTLTLLGMLTVMFLINWQFTLLSMIVVPGLFAIVLLYTISIKAATKKAAAIGAQVADIATEDIGAITEVKAFTLEGRESLRFNGHVRRLRDAKFRAGRKQSEFTPLVLIATAISNATIIGVGSYVATGHTFHLGVLSIAANTLTLGTLTVFITYLKQLYQPMRDLSKLINLASTAASGAERIQAALDEAPEVVESRPGYTGPKRLTGAVRLRDVNFGYVDRHSVLKHISLDLEPGKRIALVGLSGSGKTTLVKLIPRFYDVWSGSIEIDGLDNREYPLALLRGNISFVLQDSILFEGTIYDNIALGRPGASDREIVQAAKQAHIHQTIATMEGGYAAQVREHGKNLSSGQRQRLAIARAILRDSPILILDEPTANLDVQAEAEVMHAIEQLVTDRTVIMISHRLSTLGQVDEIVVLRDGKISEQGTYGELKRHRGEFMRLLEEQNRYNVQSLEDPLTPARVNNEPDSARVPRVRSRRFETEDQKSASSPSEPRTLAQP
jgi:ABC-type multidrug transport system fused ATPase/permease subunit